MTGAVAHPRRRRSDHQHLVISRSDLATAIQAGLQSWATITGSALHPGVRAEISAHLVAAIARAGDAEPTPPAKRWWNDLGEQERGE